MGARNLPRRRERCHGALTVARDNCYPCWTIAVGLPALSSPVTLLYAGLTAGLAAVGVGLALWARRRRATRARRRLPMVCPACRRAYPQGTLFCAFDANRLGAVGEGARAAPPGGGRCPRCRRAFAASVRFCPVDAEELMPLPTWQAHADGGLSVEPHHDHLFTGDGKICPRCAARYDLEASFCGRDGAELVTVN
jgi:hypothetical protein